MTGHLLTIVPSSHGSTSLVQASWYRHHARLRGLCNGFLHESISFLNSLLLQVHALVASSYMIVGIVGQTHAPSPLRIPFNSNTTPGLSSDIDGPWPTVHLTYGPDSLGLDCYLTLWNQSVFVPSQRCVKDPTATDSQPGSDSSEAQQFPCSLTMPLFYEPSRPFDDNSNEVFDLNNVYVDKLLNQSHTFFDPLNISGTAKGTLDTLAGFGSNQKLPNASVLVATNLTHHFLGANSGSPFLNLPLLFPSLSLRGDTMDGADYDGHNLLPYLSKAKVIPSRSFGMHIGSVDPYVAGSLLLGGYDRPRILGPLCVYDSEDWLSLVSMGIGAEEGYIPLEEFISLNGSYLQGPVVKNLVKQGSYGDVIGTLTGTLNVDPGVPYMYLSKDSCDTLASALNLTYDSWRNLYTWTNLTVMNSLSNSTSFLALNLSVMDGTDSSKSSITIKIPFTLLSKTFSVGTPPGELDSPAAGSHYFPCSPLPGPSVDREPFTPTLGRSFLQSAFYGMNFDTGQSMLAQAPGPANLSGTGDVVTIDPLTRMVSTQDTAASDAWTKSWTGVLRTWITNANVGLKRAQTKHSLSRNGKIGISASLSAVLFISVVAALVIATRRSRRHQETIRLEMLEEDALAREYETLKLEQIHRVPENNDLSSNTDREEENRMLLESEVESTLQIMTELGEGIEIESS